MKVPVVGPVRFFCYHFVYRFVCFAVFFVVVVCLFIFWRIEVVCQGYIVTRHQGMHTFGTFCDVLFAR